MTDFGNRPLGMRRPTDDRHKQRYPLRVVSSFTVEKHLPLPVRLRPYYDQGVEGSCVGFAASWAKSIIETDLSGRLHKFDARWLYRAAQEVDEWSDTPPAEGTSVRAAFDVLRDRGHVRVVGRRGGDGEPSVAYAVEENRWASSVDEMRSCIAGGVPIVIGVNWYANFDTPERMVGGWWVGRGDLGAVRGGHAVCVYAASDERQGFKFVNNWGEEYPLCWIPYDVMDRLIRVEGGEATIITDVLPANMVP